MKAAQLPEIILRRGLFWPGRVIRCFADATAQTPSTLTSWTPVMQVRAQAGGAVLWTFATTITDNVVTMTARTGAENLALTPGRYKTQLSFVDALGRPVGPYAECPVVVKDEVSVPTPP